MDSDEETGAGQGTEVELLSSVTATGTVERRRPRPILSGNLTPETLARLENFYSSVADIFERSIRRREKAARRASSPLPWAPHHSEDRRVAFRYALRV